MGIECYIFCPGVRNAFTNDTLITDITPYVSPPIEPVMEIELAGYF